MKPVHFHSKITSQEGEESKEKTYNRSAIGRGLKEGPSAQSSWQWGSQPGTGHYEKFLTVSIQ